MFSIRLKWQPLPFIIKKCQQSPTGVDTLSKRCSNRPLRWTHRTRGGHRPPEVDTPPLVLSFASFSSHQKVQQSPTEVDTLHLELTPPLGGNAALFSFLRLSSFNFYRCVWSSPTEVDSPNTPLTRLPGCLCLDHLGQESPGYVYRHIVGCLQWRPTSRVCLFSHGRASPVVLDFRVTRVYFITRS